MPPPLVQCALPKAGSLVCGVSLTSLPARPEVSIELPGRFTVEEATVREGQGLACTGTRWQPGLAAALQTLLPSVTQQVGEWEREGWMCRG